MMQDYTHRAINTLKSGGIAIFPTDTAFGIGCRIDDERAVERLFKIRKRSETKATPVLVSDLEMAKEYWQRVPWEVEEKLISKYWPGALTIILSCKIEKVPNLVRGGGDTLGSRMPNHKILLDIIKEVDVPILGTSANFAGGQTSYRFEDLDPELMEQVDFVLPGDCSAKQASTVIDCSETPWKILRNGATKIDLGI